MAVLTKKITGVINLSDFSILFNFVVIRMLLLLTLLLLLFPANSPCVGVA